MESHKKIPEQPIYLEMFASMGKNGPILGYDTVRKSHTEAELQLDRSKLNRITQPTFQQFVTEAELRLISTAISN